MELLQHPTLATQTIYPTKTPGMETIDGRFVIQGASISKISMPKTGDSLSLRFP